jgi:hypothetical protein
VAHEDLAPKANDRVVVRSVPVVLVATSVEIHHAPDVLGGPEDVVVEEAIAVVGRLLGDLRAPDGAVPHERRDAIERARRGREAGQRGAEPALPVDHVLSPQPMQEGIVLDRQLDAVADVLAEPGVDRAGVAAAQHEVDAPVHQVLEHRVVLGDLDRVIGRDEGRRGGQDEVARLRADRGQGRGGRGAEERRVVMLAKGEHVQAHCLRVPGDGDHGRDPLVL